MATGEKKRVDFISHIAEEASLGEVLRDYLDGALGERDIFFSSDKTEGVGKKWLDEIEENLLVSDLILVL